MRKLLRSLRLDQSDSHIFAEAAEAGEWAVPGTFAFLELEPEKAARKDWLAFTSSWLGCTTFGRCSLVEVAEIQEAEFFALVERLARHFVERYGASSLTAALPAAREEAELAASLAREHKTGTLLAIARELDEAGSIRESYRVIRPKRAGEHAKIWTLVEGDEEPAVAPGICPQVASSIKDASGRST